MRIQCDFQFLVSSGHSKSKQHTFPLISYFCPSSQMHAQIAILIKENYILKENNKNVNEQLKELKDTNKVAKQTDKLQQGIVTKQQEQIKDLQRTVKAQQSLINEQQKTNNNQQQAIETNKNANEKQNAKITNITETNGERQDDIVELDNNFRKLSKSMTGLNGKILMGRT